MDYNKKIPLEQDKIQLIIKSFEDGEFEYTETFKEHPTVTRNGRGASIWNNIHTQLVKNFSMPGFTTGKIGRGPWELVYLFDESTKYLYTFMRKKNFINLHKENKASKRLFHYTNVLSKLNGNLLGTYTPKYQQLSFIDAITIDDKTQTKLEALLQEMVSAIEGDIKRYAIVLVDCKQGIVKQIECIIPIAYMNPMYIEDWSEYINAEYAEYSYQVEETKPDSAAVMLYALNSDINLSIRENKPEEKKEK